MSNVDVSRRHFIAGAAGIAVLGVSSARAQIPLPKSPVTLNIVDVAGNLALTKKGFEDYQKAHPNLVSRLTFNQAPAPELPGKIKAQEDAGRLDIDLVLTGNDALSAGIEQKLWVNLLGSHASQLPKLNDILLEPAARMQALAEGQGIIVTYYPSGPLLEYMPDRVTSPPTTAEGLLAWAKAHPNRFMYARPANSGPGRTFIMGLPYILGDKDPKDPIKGWDKTWTYLQDLGQYIEYYPTGTTVTMKELGEGSRDIIATTTGWDINPRFLGIVPKEAKVGTLKGFHWVVDAHYFCVPKGVPNDKMAVLLDLINFMLSKKAQAYTYDEGYFYPGPAVKGVTLAMAPADSQKVIKEYGRPEYDRLIADNPKEVPLDADSMVRAFLKWDQDIGSRKAQVGQSGK
jgi:putative spermidine/putrescine transport system substrate-binding protein